MAEEIRIKRKRAPGGGRKKGTEKTGGRDAGTPNKATRAFEAMVKDFRDANFEAAVQKWKEIDDPKDALKVYIDLVKLVTPTPQAITIDANLANKSYNDELRKMCEEYEEQREREMGKF